MPVIVYPDGSVVVGNGDGFEGGGCPWHEKQLGVARSLRILSVPSLCVVTPAMLKVVVPETQPPIM